MCRSVSATARNAETVARMSTSHNSGSQMNLATLTNCHSVDGDLTISAQANGHSEIELGGDFFRNDP